MKFFKKTLCAAACALSLSASALPGHAALFDNVEEARLENGLKVILMEKHMAPAVTFQLWYHAGSRKDPWGLSGLAHVFEHMMFKGTDTYSGEAFTRMIRERGGDFNAFTAYDFAGYYANMPTEEIAVAMELEADRMQNLVLRRQDFETELQVVMEERRLRVEDNPRAYLHEQTRAAAFRAQPYHWPIIGWMGDLRRLGLEDMKRHYNAYYRPENAFIVAVGDFEKKEMLAGIRKWFGDIPAKGGVPLFDYEDPPQRGERRVSVHTHAELPHIIIGYHVPTMENSDAYVLEVIASILSGGKSAPLHRELVVEKHLAVSVSAHNPFFSKDPDLFLLSAQPMPEIDPARLERALLDIVDGLSEGAVDERELDKAKNQLETSFLYRQDSLFYQGMLLARYEIASEWESIRSYVPSIRKVGAEDVQRVAERYFTNKNRTVGILYPEGGKNGSEKESGHRSSSEEPGEARKGGDS
jgi:zinc protease